MFERVCGLIGEMTHRNEYCDFCSDQNSAWCNENYCKMVASKSLPIIIWVEILQMHFSAKTVHCTYFCYCERKRIAALSTLFLLFYSYFLKAQHIGRQDAASEMAQQIKIMNESARNEMSFFFIFGRGIYESGSSPFFCRLKRFWSRVHRNIRAMMKRNETIFRNIVIFCTRIC